MQPSTLLRFILAAAANLVFAGGFSAHAADASLSDGLAAFGEIVDHVRTYNCSGCHYNEEPSKNLAYWSNSGRWTTEKGLAYRHFAVKQALVDRLGPDAAAVPLSYLPRLNRPAITSGESYDALFDWISNALSRDGETTPESIRQDHPEFLAALRRWQAADFPLPPALVDAMICEIRTRQPILEDQTLPAACAPGVAP